MYRKNHILFDLLDPEIIALGYELWGIELSQNGRGTILRVYIDRGKGITIEDCSLVSQHLTGFLEVEDPVVSSYLLEVSSPGLDRLFFKPMQFKPYIGQKVKLYLARKICDRKRFTANLVAVNEDEIVISLAGEEIVLRFDDIEKARLIPEF